MSFEEYLTEQQLAKTTLQTHMRNYHKITNFLYGESITNTPVKTNEEICDFFDKETTLSQRKSLSSTMSKYYQFQSKDNKFILNYLRQINNKLKDQHKQRSESIIKDAPSYNELIKLTDQHYENQNYRGFIIMYLFTTFCCRNQDLIADIVDPHHEQDDSMNYFVKSPLHIRWIRNNYKTSDKYGKKIQLIQNKKFIDAIYKLEYILKKNDNIDREIKKVTNGVTETTICKIVLATRSKGAFNDIDDISQSRGTSLKTLHQSYNIDNEK